jgi:hypothetical protein
MSSSHNTSTIFRLGEFRFKECCSLPLDGGEAQHTVVLSDVRREAPVSQIVADIYQYV